MGDADLFRALAGVNTHWLTNEVSPLIKRSPHRRRSFQPLRTRLERLPFYVLAGPRQVGKTTLMGHLMEELLNSGTPREAVLYAPLDQPPVSAELGGQLEPLVACFERYVAKAPLAQRPSPAYFFLDEIHTLDDWGLQLKGLHDRYHPWLRVLATGSSSAAIFNPATADHPGRFERGLIYPLKYRECLEIQHPQLRDFAGQAKSWRDAWNRLGRDASQRNSLASVLENLHRESQPHHGNLQATLDHYFLRGGYPAAQPPATWNDALRFFEATLDAVIGNDLKTYGNVRKPGTFKIFLAKLGKEHGGKFVARSHADDLGVDKETPAGWKHIAEEVFLVHQLGQLNENLHPVPAKADKAYLQDPGIRSYLTATPDLADLETSGRIGEVAEGVLFDHLRRIQFNMHGHRNGVIGYWSKPEVDFLVQLPHAWLAIESKYRRRPRGSHLRRLATERPDLLCIEVTRDDFDVDGAVWQMPLWMLLLMC
jgi:uncharacterized protein